MRDAGDVNNQRPQQGSADSGADGPPVALIVGLIVAAAAALFVISNRDEVEVDFILFSVQSRTWTALVVAIALGVSLDRLFLAWWRRRRR
jgi:uncharacterized integral membrane protein